MSFTDFVGFEGDELLMSLFGDHLRALIDNNKVNIYELANNVGLERTTIHKIMSDNRIPSKEYVTKLADALPLSPEERRHFMESYNISRIGEFKYNQREQVKKLIESIVYIENGNNVKASSAVLNKSSIDDAKSTAIGHYAVNNLVKSMIGEVIAADKNPEIDFVVSMGYQYFYNELLTSYIVNPQLRIRHIVAFSKKVDFYEKQNNNLETLSQALPFAFAPGAGYNLNYYYSDSRNSSITQVMPNFILTSLNKLVLISRDFDRAVLVRDTDVVDLYRERFDVALEQSNPLIRHLDSIGGFLDFCNEADIRGADAPSHWIEPEPCVAPVIDADLVNAKLKTDIPDRDKLLKNTVAHFGFLRENQLRNINICTVEGIGRLVDSGLIYYTPEWLINPLTREEVKELLIRLINRIQREKVKILFTNPSKFAISPKFLVGVNRISGIDFFMFYQDISDFRIVSFSEESINEAFVDFIESIEESELVYDACESLTILNNIIDEL